MSRLRALFAPRAALSFEQTIPVGVPLQALWLLLANTQRVNHAIGLPEARFERIRGQSALTARARFLGMQFRWQELPFEWVEGRRYSVERLLQGPIARTIVGVHFAPLDEQRSKLTVSLDVYPRTRFGRLLGVFMGRWTFQHYRALCRTLEHNYQTRQQILFPPPQPPEVNEEALARLAATLRAQPALDADLLDRLVAHLRQAADESVLRMRPFALADEWGVPRDETLRLFLHATRAGLLDLRWEVLCPNCRVAKASYATLGDLKERAHCETCHITFDANFDQYVELRFSANPRVREAAAYTYCVGGPFMTPHIKVQARIAVGETRAVALPLPPGSYRLRCRGLPARALVEVVADGAAPQRAPLLLDAEGPEAVTLRLHAGEATGLTVLNRTEEEALLIVEQRIWDQQGVSAARVSTMQEFRDLFSSELLAPGLGIEIRTLTLMFTDLKDSTILYERAGDSPAYTQVQDHFVALSTAVREHHGALVKTIGDAVMAVFHDASDALRAAIACQRAIARLNEASPTRPPLVLKLGLHTGPCIAITANNVMDYFGSTVNAASRAQGLSVGGDIVLTQATMNDPQVAALVGALPEVERFTATLRGLTPTFTLYRLRSVGTLERWNAGTLER